MQILVSKKNVSFMMIVLLTIGLFGMNPVSAEKGSVRAAETNHILLLSGYISPIADEVNHYGDVEVSEFILDFSVTVDISAVEMFVDVIFTNEFDITSIVSLSGDDRQWLMQLYEPISSQTWTDFVVIQNGNRMEFDTLAIEMQQDRIIHSQNETDLIKSPFIDSMLGGLAITVMQFKHSINHNETLRNAEVVASNDGIKVHQRIDSRKTQIVTVRNEYVNEFNGNASSSIDSGPFAAVCCDSGEMCGVFGGNKCPGGFQPASCPCTDPY